MKPTLKLTGTDGNAFAILGAAVKAAKRAKMPADTIAAFKTEAMSGDYNHLLSTVSRYFDRQVKLADVPFLKFPGCTSDNGLLNAERETKFHLNGKLVAVIVRMQ